jgi:hypothetical protein
MSIGLGVNITAGTVSTETPAGAAVRVRNVTERVAS